MQKKDCRGCYNNDYNNGLGGAKQCWSFDASKKLVKKYKVHINQVPPYPKSCIVTVPPCYCRQQFAYPSLSSIDAKGFWK